MLIRCGVAQPEDAARISRVHMAAFGPNAMLRAQFPSEEIRRDLQRSIEMKALADIQDSNTTVLIVQRIATAMPRAGGKLHDDTGARPSDGAIIGFAKWSHPIELNDDYEEPQWVWPEGTAFDVLNDWTRVTEAAQNVAIGSKPCYSKYSSIIISAPYRTSRLFYLTGTRYIQSGILVDFAKRRAYFHCDRSAICEAGSWFAYGSMGY